MIGIVSVAMIYMLVQVVVSGTLSDPAATPRPIADSAAAVMGSRAASAIAIGALLSIYGYLSANMLHTPRLTFALAERGDIPAIFARIHPRFRTPHVSIALYTVFLLAFTLSGNFRWNITLSAIVRLFAYGSIAVALSHFAKAQPCRGRISVARWTSVGDRGDLVLCSTTRAGAAEPFECGIGNGGGGGIELGSGTEAAGHRVRD